MNLPRYWAVDVLFGLECLTPAVLSRRARSWAPSFVAKTVVYRESGLQDGTNFALNFATEAWIITCNYVHPAFSLRSFHTPWIQSFNPNMGCVPKRLERNRCA